MNRRLARLRRSFWTTLWEIRVGLRRFVSSGVQGVSWVGNAVRSAVARLLGFIGIGLWGGVLLVAARFSRRFRAGKQRLWWGPEPIVTVKYLSDALGAAGYDSTAVATTDYPVFKSVGFDLYYDDLVGASRLPRFIASRSTDYVVFLHLLKNFDIAHIPFTGGPLGRTRLAWLEPHLLRWAGIRTVMLPYGGDFWRYAWVTEALLRHVYLIDYPEPGRDEDRVERRVKRWMRHADIVVCTTMVEGASRWDVMATDFNIAPPDRVRPRDRWEMGDGESGAVSIVHAPNHRGVKGTEFILGAIDALRRKGYEIDLLLLENRPNEEVLEALRHADICVDHCIGSGWGQLAVEAMGSGATVIANVEDERRLGVHRHFGWLNQSPLVSANIDQIEETLEFLIRRPSLRAQLGRIGVEFVRRFHSPETAQYLFGSIYRKLAGEDVDLMRLFHPITSEYMTRYAPLNPPLLRNRPRELSEDQVPSTSPMS